MPFYKAVLIVLACLALFPVRARAYLPSARDLLADVTSIRVRVETLEAVYEAVPPADASAEGDASGRTDVTETVFFRAPDRIRLNLSSSHGEEVWLAANTKTLSLAGDQAVDKPWPQPFVLFRLLIEADPDRLAALLADLDFDLDQVHLGRDEDRMVYIIGAEPGSTQASQVWFERKTLRLTRLIYQIEPGVRYDARLLDYRRRDPEIDWPQEIRLDQSPGDIRRISLVSLEVKTRPEQEAIELESGSLPPVRDPNRWTVRDPDLDEIRKMVDWFEKKLQ